jgi:hypothetical protein
MWACTRCGIVWCSMWCSVVYTTPHTIAHYYATHYYSLLTFTLYTTHFHTTQAIIQRAKLYLLLDKAELAQRDIGWVHALAPLHPDVGSIMDELSQKSDYFFTNALGTSDKYIYTCVSECVCECTCVIHTYTISLTHTHTHPHTHARALLYSRTHPDERI